MRPSFGPCCPTARGRAVAVLATNVEAADFTSQVDHVPHWACLRMDARRRLQYDIRRDQQA